jgi:BirA family biotin operon repressor/biotin-[acetyl-CoA-carboxylase] ligase
MQEKILDFLKKTQDYVSGDQISRSLKMTRQALWKHIQSLKDDGYDIVAVPHLGYRLINLPDKLFPQEVGYNLNTAIVGKKIYYLETVSTTMDVALRLGAEGAVEGTIVLAEMQTKGRGRLGRNWLSPKYKGIYLSLILRPKISLSQASLLTLLSAISVCEAIKEVTSLEAKIKWPNDIILNDKKLGGILIELNAETDQVKFVVIGLGLNINNDKKSLPDTAISLKEAKKEEISRVELLKEILRRMESNYKLFQKGEQREIIEKWRVLNITLGKRIKIAFQKEHLEGEALEIDTDGGLLVRRDSGMIEKIMSGDIVHRC